MKRIVRLIAGFLLLVLGFIGLFLPVLQGILFIILGLLLLAPESEIIRSGLEKLKKRYPDIFLKVRNLTKDRKLGE
jgi:uncharacterized membrane protein YbaN (DUF454 family)